MQHKPKFNGIILAAVLMVLTLLFVSLSPLMSASASQHIYYSTVRDYFRNNQVTSFRLDLNTASLEMWLKEGEVELPKQESTSTASSGGLLTGLTGSESDALPQNGGTVHMTYKLPYYGIFNNGEVIDAYIDAYNAANPDQPMVYDYIAQRSSFPWAEVIIYAAMLGMVILMFMSMYRGGAGGSIMNVGRAKVKDQQENQRKATFADVAGADEEKAELQEVVEFLKAPGKFNSLGARIPHGVLLVGPPGTGKTLLARACAGEAGVPFYAISGSDFVEMYVGVGASRVRDLFEKAKKTMPSIVFIDEIDAVGRQRGAGLGGGHDEREQTLNQLLVEMDGFAVNEGVVVLAATNRVDILDPALLRPGRFDRQVYVGLPDIKGREEILKIHAKGKPLAEDVELGQVARSTAGFTGADLENLLNEAALLAGRRDQKFITEDVIHEAVIKVIAGPEKRSRVIPEIERKLTAYHEAGHAVVIHALPDHDPVHQITIVPRGQAGGMTIFLPEEDRSYRSKAYMTEQIVSLLGGRAAEEMMLGDISTGASSDIQRATAIARKMVGTYGMSDKLGNVAFDAGTDEVFIGKSMGHTRPYSEKTAAEMDEEIRAMIDSAYDRCREILTAYRPQLVAVAEYLLVHETMDAETFEACFADTAAKDSE